MAGMHGLEGGRADWRRTEGFGEGDGAGGPDGNVALQWEGSCLQSPLKETLNKVLCNSLGPLERICVASGRLLCQDGPRGLLCCG